MTCFEGHPKTQFIWCHAGISRRINVKNLTTILDKVLEEHKDHVHIDLSWVVLQAYVLKDLKAWSALISKYPDNFMVGSDIVGGLRNYVSTIRAYDKLFTALKSEALVKKVASDNFIGLMPKKGVSLKPDYKYPENKYVKRK